MPTGMYNPKFGGKGQVPTGHSAILDITFGGRWGTAELEMKFCWKEMKRWGFISRFTEKRDWNLSGLEDR